MSSQVVLQENTAMQIATGFKRHMKNTFSKNKTCFSFLLIVFSAYVMCYLLSQTVFHEVYLFEWTADHYYLFLWAAPVTFCFLEMYKAALITTIGNWAGILTGQVLGDFIIKINTAKITPDMYIGKVWQLKTHYGVLIWLAVFLISFIIGIRIEKKDSDGIKNDKSHHMSK